MFSKSGAELNESLLVPSVDRCQLRKRDLEHLDRMNIVLVYAGNILNRTILNAAQVVTQIFVDEAAHALQLVAARDAAFSREYSKLAYLAGACRRWATEEAAGPDLAAFVLGLQEMDLVKLGPKSECLRKNAFRINSCQVCEAAGARCGSCATCWLSVALEKARMHGWLCRNLKDKLSLRGPIPESATNLLQKMVRLALPKRESELDEASRQALEPWLEVIRGEKNEMFAKRQTETLREHVCAALMKNMSMRPESASLDQQLLRDPARMSQLQADLLSKAAAYRDSCLAFLTAKDDYDASWTEAVTEGRPEQNVVDRCQVPGQLNEGHRLFVLSAELFHEDAKTPWIAGTDAYTKSKVQEFKKAMQFMKLQATGSGDVILIGYAGNCRLRRLVEDEFKAQTRPSHVGNVSVFFSKPPRPGRRIFASTESWNGLLWCKSARVRIAAVAREDCLCTNHSLGLSLSVLGLHNRDSQSFYFTKQ